MAKKAKVETPPSMLGIMRFDVDTSKMMLSPQAVIGIILAFVVLVLAMQMIITG